VFGGVGQSFLQGLGEWQLGQQIRFERSQALAQILQGVQFTLYLGFTLLLGEVIELFRHAAYPEENVVMITTREPLVRLLPSVA
jgi:hypothetical protein